MTEETKVRLMVIPIVVMLAVTMLVAGWQQEKKPVQIEVEEGYEEITTEYLEGEEGPIEKYNKATALTHINNEKSLEFKVTLTFISNHSHPDLTINYQQLKLDLQVEGDFEERLGLEKMKIKVSEIGETEEIPNLIHFLEGDTNIEGGDVRTFTNIEGERYIAFDIGSNEFEAETEIQWEIRGQNVGEDFTLELQAVADGNISETVNSTVEIHVQGDNS
ncbi:MAG: hypothetical protein ACLFU5_01075 [Thermoplasmata archaeon]